MGNLSRLVGDLKDIVDISEKKEEKKILNKLKNKEGLKYYSKCSSNILELGLECAKKTIQEFNLDISRIFICTESHWDTSCFDIPGLDKLKVELNCQKAHLMGISFSFCCNLQLAINTAIPIVKQSTDENILVISTDRCSPEDSRIIGDDLSVLSDGASSFIISKNKNSLKKPFRVVSNEILSDSSIKNFSDEIDYDLISGIAGLFKFMNHCSSLKKKVFSKSDSKTINNFITNNYKKSVCTVFSILFKYPHSADNVELISKWAHVHSSDMIFSMIEMYNKFEENQNIFCFSSGPQSWGATLFQKT